MSLLNFCNLPKYVSEINSQPVSGKLPGGVIYISNTILVMNLHDKHFYDSVDYDTICLSHYIDELFQLQDIRIVDKIGAIIGHNEIEFNTFVKEIKHELFSLYYKNFQHPHKHKIFSLQLTFYVKKDRHLYYIARFGLGDDLISCDFYSTITIEEKHV